MRLERFLAPLLLLRSNPLNNPALSLNDPSTWDSLLDGSESDAGIRVSPTKALSLAAVWQATGMISADVAKLPLNKYQRTGDDDADRDVAAGDHVQRMVRREANDEESAFRFWRRFMFHALLWNRAYAFIDRDGAGRPRQLINLLPDRTCAERRGGKLFFVTETSRPDGTPWLRPLDANEVLHIQGPSIESEDPCELIHYARQAFGLGLALQKFAARFFKNGVRTGGLLELPASMKPTTADRVEEGFRKNQTGEENWFKTVILRDGAKFHQTSVAPNEGQMTESREEQVREVARYFNLSPSRLGLSDSVSYNSKAEDNQAYLDSTLSPWLCEIAGECDRKLLTQTERDADSHFFEHNTKALLRMNTLQRYQVYAIAVRNRINTPNECRRKENEGPLPGGDEFPPLAGAGAAVTPTNGKPDGGADKGDGPVPPRGPASDAGTEPGNGDQADA